MSTQLKLSLYSCRLISTIRYTLSVVAVGLVVASGVTVAQEAATQDSAVQVNLSQDGSLTGRVITAVDSEDAPVVARVTLTANGVTVASGTTDVVGNFSFQDVEPGVYEMVGVSGQYVGGQSIVVGKAVEGSQDDFELRVSTASSTQAVPFSDVPMSTYSAGCSSCNAPAASSCGSCGGGGFGGGGGGGLIGGGLGGSGSLRRLLLIGGAVAIPVAIASDASPDN